MHREGHIGIGLLIYSPIAYVFVKADLMVLFGLGMVAMGAWSFLPDIDMQLPVPHRGPTHSLVAATLAGVLTAAGFGYFAYTGTFELARITASYWVSMGVIVVSGFGFGFLGVVSHLIGDVLTPMGIQPFWPRSNRHYSLGLVLAADKDANRQLSFIGALALTGAIVLPSL